MNLRQGRGILVTNAKNLTTVRKSALKTEALAPDTFDTSGNSIKRFERPS